MSHYDYDLIVIGAGAGGFVSAKLAAGLGKRVAMIEKDRLGGECTNRGCIPSKALLKAATVAHQAQHLRKYGLEPAGDFGPSTRNVMNYVRAAVAKVYDSHPAAVFEKAGITVVFGAPKFLDSHRIDVSGTVLSADKFMIATGSSAAVPPIAGLLSVPFLTNENVFDLETIPKSLIVLGGGPVGIELASAFNRLGSQTAVVEALETILSREDPELAQKLAGRLVSEDLRLMTGTRALRVSSNAGEIVLTVENDRRQVENICAQALLVAVGRKPNVEGLDLEKAGVESGPTGIRTDPYLRTAAPNIFACGDVVGPYLFSHMTEYQAVTATRNAFLPFRKKVSYDTVAWCTFTDPELAHVGLTEEEARKIHGERIRVYRYEYGDTDRGRTDGTEFGLAKFILGRGGRLLGAHILGERAGEVIHEAQLVKFLKLPFSAVAPMIHIYPTYTDVVRQPAKLYYIDRLRSNPFVKILARVLGNK